VLDGCVQTDYSSEALKALIMTFGGGGGLWKGQTNGHRRDNLKPYVMYLLGNCLSYSKILRRGLHYFLPPTTNDIRTTWKDALCHYCCFYWGLYPFHISSSRTLTKIKFEGPFTTIKCNKDAIVWSLIAPPPPVYPPNDPLARLWISMSLI
jgi:hypothetical protein